jgi:PST family polysaccharide transporter
MTLVKTSLLNAIAVFVKMLTLLSVNKVLAVYVGPSGYAVIGQFQNAVQVFITFASGAINTGVTKYTSEYYYDECYQRKIWRTAGSIALVASIIATAALFFYCRELAVIFLNDKGYSDVFVWFAVSLVFFAINSLLLAILNGRKEIHLYVAASICGSLISFLITVLLVVSYGLYGALVALATYQSVALVATLFACYRAKWFKLSYLFGRIDGLIAKNLAKYTAMALTSAICVPFSHMLVRDHLGETFGWEAAGYWDAMWRLSAAYLMLITTTLSVYYLPRLSELTKVSEIKSEILQGYKIILPVVAIFGLIIFLLRDLIIAVLFSSDFFPMRQLFAWQMVGDTLKIGSWILAYLLLGKAMTKAFIFAEIVFCACFVVLTYLLTDKFGFEGSAMAHAATYLIYWALLAALVLVFLRRNDRESGEEYQACR